MVELSVIIPFCNEFPQVLFTVQSVAQELRDRVDFEIIAVNNFCDEVAAQGKKEDPGAEALKATMRQNPWLKVINYREKLSHWQAKNLGVKNSTGRFLWFCDAHCVVSRDSLYKVLETYRRHWGVLDGTLHLPLTYKITEAKRMIYKLVTELDHGYVHYSFTRYRDALAPYPVPCMSTCGMMMSRELYDALGGWPTELGIYGGGENFINFTLAVLGKTVHIMPGGPLFHHGAPREYSWNYTDFKRNQIIATYLFGGRELAELFTKHSKGNQEVLHGILKDLFMKCADHREHIKRQQKLGIRDWVKIWRNK